MKDCCNAYSQRVFSGTVAPDQFPNLISGASNNCREFLRVLLGLDLQQIACDPKTLLSVLRPRVGVPWEHNHEVAMDSTKNCIV